MDRLTYRIAVRLVPGGTGSAEAHALAVGAVVLVSGPRQAFPFVPKGPLLFVAGGIGITPILPMVHWSAVHGHDYRLVYTGRSRAAMPFLDELPISARVRVRTDEAGLPTSHELLADAPEGASLYVCGPTPLLEALRHAWSGPVHFERFAPPPIQDGDPFELRLGRGGPVVPVAANESALTALRRVNPDVAYSCRQGFCGTCEVRVVPGAVDHRGYLPSTEDGMLICVARAAGARVVLDM
ncbi:PDR/VanB family oxidoreductase [Actinokineospora sp. NBRC 105648]|uniref:PDR/VanB family oxidoreductase n=1 Tax=Actinokineospora sp. NBRC 105648 TaxID=3032206 RepID=UPI0024A14BF2|nr:hypothetical protein Acsp05_34920 [Actinokineospora sp. NBRC 105648]